MVFALPDPLLAEVIRLVGSAGLVMVLASHAACALRTGQRACALHFAVNGVAGLCMIPAAVLAGAPVLALAAAGWTLASLLGLAARRIPAAPRPVAIPPAQIPWTALAREARPFSRAERTPEPHSRAATDFAA